MKLKIETDHDRQAKSVLTLAKRDVCFGNDEVTLNLFCQKDACELTYLSRTCVPSSNFTNDTGSDYLGELETDHIIITVRFHGLRGHKPRLSSYY